jgi:hypothetical protein
MSDLRCSALACVLFAVLSVTVFAGAAMSQGIYIPNVPDANQPPDTTLGGALDNYCAPMSAINITGYWDTVFGHTNAPGVNMGFALKKAAKYMGYFMGTNGQGAPARWNNPLAPLPGTYPVDQDTGFCEYVRWDAANLFGTPPPVLPPSKRGYDWKFTYTDITLPGVSLSDGFRFCAAEIDSGHPVKIDFSYWNPVPTGISYVDMASGDTIFFYEWGDSVDHSDDPDHDEQWNWQLGQEGIGHAVTGVGYFRSYDPDGAGGPLLPDDYMVVHDNWRDTAENVAIPFAYWNAAIAADPGFGRRVDNIVDVSTEFDWCAITSWPGTMPPGYMGIATDLFSFYFPSDSLGPYIAGYPKAWLSPDLHPATRFGPEYVRLWGTRVHNSFITVPDRFGRPCELYVEIPTADLIDEATDYNVIRLAAANDSAIIGLNDTVDTFVFLACCDGYVEYAEWPDTSEHLVVEMMYNDATVDTFYFDDIHPAGRLDMNDPIWPPSWLFIYGNETFMCTPAYQDNRNVDPYHSEAWHWYALYPDPEKEIGDIGFKTRYAGSQKDVYILAASYSRWAGTAAVAPDDAPGRSGGFRLMQNRPNPFRRTTEILYVLPRDCRVVLEIYNVMGQRTAMLIDEEQEAGLRTAYWDASAYASGIYFYRLRAGGFIETRKLLLLK